MVYSGIVKWHGNHYYAGDKVIGTKIEWRGDELWLFDDEETYISGIGDFTRYEWVEIEPSSLVEEELK